MPEDSNTAMKSDPEVRTQSPCPSSEGNGALGGSAGAAPAPREAKRLWTPAEDEQLVAVVQKYGASRWSLIATHVPGRAGKQCRERWFNHLCPEVKKGEWTQEEDETLIRAVAELGSQWSVIVKRMPGRTDNAIKNRYNTIKRRAKSLQQAAAAPAAAAAAATRWSREPAPHSPASASAGAPAVSPSPKRLRDAAGVAGSDAAGIFAEPDATTGVADVFGALLEGIPAPNPLPPPELLSVGTQGVPSTSEAAQTRRERVIRIAAQLVALDATDSVQHPAIDALINEIIRATATMSPRGSFTATDSTAPADPCDGFADSADGGGGGVHGDARGHKGPGSVMEVEEENYTAAEAAAAITGPEVPRASAGTLSVAEPFAALNVSSPKSDRGGVRPRSGLGGPPRSRRASTRVARRSLSLEPLHLPEPAADDLHADNGVKRARADANDNPTGGASMGEAEAAMDSMMAALFHPDVDAGADSTDALGVEALLGSTPTPSAVVQAPSPCTGGATGPKMPLTPSAMLNALVDAF